MWVAPFACNLAVLCSLIAVSDAQAETDNDCKPLTDATCRELGYSMVHAPGEHRQHDASLELRQFYPLIKIGCSKYIKEFLCGVYLPECSADTGEPIRPCRALCKEAKSGCQSLMEKYGFRWPKMLNCRKFPTRNCKGIVPKNEGTEDNLKIRITITTVNITKGSNCEPVSFPICKHVEYKSHYPNLNAATVFDAGVSVSSFTGLINSECSPHIGKFVCAIYAPECTEDQETVYPCRSVCESVRSSCETYMNSFGFLWPDSMTCDSLPTENCVGLDETLETNAESASCKTVDISSCQHLGYNSTSYPYAHDRTQNEVVRMIEHIYPFVGAECFELVEEMYCFNYFPPCQADGDRPCRSLCDEIRRACDTSQIPGFSWPEEFECAEFPNENCLLTNEVHGVNQSEEIINDVQPLIRYSGLMGRNMRQLNFTAHIMKEYSKKMENIAELCVLADTAKAALSGLMHSAKALQSNIDAMEIFLQLIDESLH